jgi:hypothetical protein
MTMSENRIDRYFDERYPDAAEWQAAFERMVAEWEQSRRDLAAGRITQCEVDQVCPEREPTAADWPAWCKHAVDDMQRAERAYAAGSITLEEFADCCRNAGRAVND